MFEQDQLEQAQIASAIKSGGFCAMQECRDKLTEHNFNMYEIEKIEDEMHSKINIICVCNNCFNRLKSEYNFYTSEYLIHIKKIHENKVKKCIDCMF